MSSLFLVPDNFHQLASALASGRWVIACLCAGWCTTCAAFRPAFAELARTHAAIGHKVGFVFGSERHGMANEDVYRCHAVISIPTDPDYGSLNLSQAVQVLAYEWRMALGGFPVVARTPDVDLAGGESVQGMLTHLEQALVQLGFLDPAAPKKLMPRLNQLFNRAELRQEDIHILRGIAKAILDRTAR